MSVKPLHEKAARISLSDSVPDLSVSILSKIVLRSASVAIRYCNVLHVRPADSAKFSKNVLLFNSNEYIYM